MASLLPIPAVSNAALDMFDGTDPEALEAARARWRAHKERSDTVTYWEQTQGGAWERRA